MKSSNPNSGIYEADTSRTLDNNCGNPACNQGGMAVVAIEGNGSRPSHRREGYNTNDVSFTLNSTERHAVCFEPRTQDGHARVVEGDVSPTLNTMGGGSETTLHSPK